MDQSLTYKAVEKISRQDRPNDLKELEDFKKNGFPTDLSQAEERTETESDTLLSTEEDLPQQNDGQYMFARNQREGPLNFLQSAYRDEISGKNKVYRLIIRSIDPQKAKNKINLLVNKYNGRNSVPSKNSEDYHSSISGGHHFDLYINQRLAKDFIEEGRYGDDSVLLVTRSNSKTVTKDESRIFIWIKKI
jgi:hypothetical protein